MPESIFSAIIAMNLFRDGKNSGSDMKVYQSQIADALTDYIRGIRNNAISAKLFTSLRFDCDYILWITLKDASSIPEIKNAIIGSKTVASFPYYFLSLYEDSPYTKEGVTLADTLRKQALKFLVAYPMSKSNDWYLLPFEERKSIMAQHIGMAVSHKENRDIRSYTTYSFGISDQEFVVIYETDSLTAWSHVTAKLREAEARKWITKETPILVGSRSWELISEA